MGPGAAEDDLDPRPLLADLADRGPDPLVGVVRLAGDLLALGEDGLDVGQGDGGGAAFVALDDAGDQLVFLFHVLVVQGVALRLADLLDHHLLGGLGGDPLGDFLGGQGDAVVGSGDGPVLAVDVRRRCPPLPHSAFLAAETSAASMPWKTISLSMFFSRWIASTIRSSSLGFITGQFPLFGDMATGNESHQRRSTTEPHWRASQLLACAVFK